jgi:hypothetical protein
LIDLRVLFEKAITQVPPEKAREIWNLYVQFEYNYGDLNTAAKLETRKSKTYPDLGTATEVVSLLTPPLLDKSTLLSLVNRFRYMDLWPCSNAELDTFGIL